MTVITDEHPVLTRDVSVSLAPRRRRRLWSARRRLLSEGGAVFGIAAAVYLVCGSILAFHFHSFIGDAVSRMANGFYVLYSRDPHIASIGFVWNPLQSAADIVPLLLYHLWPPLATRDMAGTIVSSVCMAGAAYQLLAAFREWGVPRAPRLILVALFALNPMVIYYGANGMSEALYLFTLIATCRYLGRWIRQDDTKSLAFAAFALGFCYLARNEAVAPAVAAGVLVFAVTLRRNDGERHARAMRALTDAIVFLFPFVISFIGWAVVSYVITGSFFEQFTSVYGTTAQIEAGAGGAHVQLGPALRLEGKALLYLAPLLIVVTLWATISAVRRRDPLILVPITVIGAGLAFDLVAYISGGIIWSFRYMIAAVPLDVVLVGVAVAAAAKPTGRPKGKNRVVAGSTVVGTRIGAWTGPRIAVIAAVCGLVLVPSLPATAAGMFNPQVGSEETQVLGFVVHKTWTPLDRTSSQNFRKSQDVASYIANLRLPDGDVVVDNFAPGIPLTIVLSPNPKVWVIPNDRDFQRILADPLTFHAHYILVQPGGGQGALTATDRLYPALYSSGDDVGGHKFATLVHTFPGGGGDPRFRLYRVTSHPANPL